MASQSGGGKSGAERGVSHLGASKKLTANDRLARLPPYLQLSVKIDVQEGKELGVALTAAEYSLEDETPAQKRAREAFDASAAAQELASTSNNPKIIVPVSPEDAFRRLFPKTAGESERIGLWTLFPPAPTWWVTNVVPSPTMPIDSYVGEMQRKLRGVIIWESESRDRGFFSAYEAARVGSFVAALRATIAVEVEESLRKKFGLRALVAKMETAVASAQALLRELKPNSESNEIVASEDALRQDVREMLWPSDDLDFSGRFAEGASIAASKITEMIRVVAQFEEDVRSHLAGISLSHPLVDVWAYQFVGALAETWPMLTGDAAVPQSEVFVEFVASAYATIALDDPNENDLKNCVKRWRGPVRASLSAATDRVAAKTGSDDGDEGKSPVERGEGPVNEFLSGPGGTGSWSGSDLRGMETEAMKDLAAQALSDWDGMTQKQRRDCVFILEHAYRRDDYFGPILADFLARSSSHSA